MTNSTYDRELFIEVILTEGVRLLYVDKKLDGFFVEWYLGVNGKKVAIPVTDDCFTIPVAKFYLDHLGLASLIPRLFAETPPKPKLNIPPSVNEQAAASKKQVVK